MQNSFKILKRTQNTYFYMIILSFLGLLISVYLWYVYSLNESMVCFTDCDKVRLSQYSYFLGVRLPVWGTFYFLSVLLYSIGLFIKRKFFIRFEFERIIFFAATTGGFIFSIYLTYLEAFVIEAWCQWCVASAIISTALFFMNMADTLKKSSTKSTGEKLSE